MRKRHTLTNASARYKGQAGFSLVEVLVAVVLLSIVMVGLVGYAGYAAGMMRASKERSVASIIGREKLDEVIAMPYDSAVVGASTELVQAGRYSAYVTTAVTERESQDDLKDVIVSVANEQGRELQRFQVSIQRRWGQ